MQSTFSTIVAGVTVFVIGQVLVKLTIDPVQQLKAAISLTANTLLRHQAQITNATPNDEVSAAAKSHAADLVSKAAVVSFYPAVAFIFRLPSKANVRKAAQQLNLIGYGMLLAAQQFEDSPSHSAKKTNWASQNSLALKEISRLLKAETSY
ncbi:hypothetical protein [Pseudomonas cerasi]